MAQQKDVRRSSSLDEEDKSKHAKLFSEFKAEESASEIVSVNPFESWVAPVAARKVVLYNDNGESVRDIEVSFKVQCFGVFDRKNFILSDYSGKCIYKLSHEGELTKLVSTSPFSPNGIRVFSNDQGFVVCMVGTSGGKVVRYTHDGKSRTKTYQKDERGHPLFKFPRRVVDNLNEDLIVVDIMFRSVICVNKEGNLRWIYKGSLESRKNGIEFDPWDLAANSKEEIIVSNTKPNTIDVLSKDGLFLMYVVTKIDGISNPLGICVDSEGKLWVGQASGKVCIYNYLNES
ncbi:uncharacterized protein LOC133206206 [Saccostrea echinata]|uniref:uncharacterized protein LOC133206206 n=1 Tax=Saccostrea echinata TaxID=191078 RepID=UPI002A83A70B|nr:uncharacterized protein LOC133206206 [Saccostrea echinata]